MVKLISVNWQNLFLRKREKSLDETKKAPLGFFWLIFFLPLSMVQFCLVNNFHKYMDSISQKLKILGFEEDEISLYLAALQNGPRTAVQLSEIAAMPKLSAHAALDLLLKRGIMSSVVQDEQEFFAAEHPKIVLAYLKQSLNEKNEVMKDLEDNLFKLEAQMSDEKPSMRFFKGKDGLRAMQRDFLDSGVKSAVTFFPYTDVANVFSEEERSEVGKERREKGIKIKVIYTNEEAPASGNHSEKIDELTEKKEIPFEKFPLSSDIAVYGDKVMMTSLKGSLNGVIVESPSIAESLRSIFKLAYEAADKYKDKN